MIFGIFVSFMVLSVALLFAYLLFTSVCEAKRIEGPAAPRPLPGVTILKPMKNIDDGLEENLQSYFNIEYPDYRIIFGVDTHEDACVAVIEKVRKQHPSVRVDVIETGCPHSVNPKIDKLAKMAEGCESPLFWVTDSNTRVAKDTLSSLVREHIEHGSKIVFSPIKGTGGRTFGSIMSNAYLNLFVSGSIVSAWLLMKRPIIVGKSMLIERAALNNLGGFSAFSCYLAEDYMMGLIYRKKGIFISTNFTWVSNYASTTSVHTFFLRMSRWAKMRMRIDPFFYCLEILANPLPIACISIFFFGDKGLALAAIVYILEMATEYLSLFLVNGDDGRAAKVLVLYPLLIPLKDAILFVVYITAFFSKTVHWHGRNITIGSESRIQS